MPLLAYGINYKTAPIAVREKWSFNSTQAAETLREMRDFAAVNEAVLLSTCNRTEIYTVKENHSALEKWINTRPTTKHLDLAPYAYSYSDFDAIRHAMRVTSGLDSMVLGEPEIFGQMKQAYQLACNTGTVGKHLQHIFPAIFAASKDIRTNTAIGNNPVSMAYVIVQLAKRIFASLKNCRVLLIGAGEAIELVMTHLHSHGVHKITVANRNIEKANRLANAINGHAICIGDIPVYIKDIDIIISATASSLPILGKGMMESALKLKKHHPVLMVDLAVPRDIEQEVAQLEDVYLYNIDDLQDLISQNVKNREAASVQAESMIEIQAEHYLRQLRVVDSSELITRYRQKISRLHEQEYQKALEQLKRGKTPEEALKTMAYNLTNKITHQPTIKLRKAAYNNEVELLRFAKELLDL